MNLQQQMRQVQWNANKRTMGRKTKVPESVLLEAEDALNSGKHDKAVELLRSLEPSAIERDHSALAVLALGYFGLGQYDDALRTIDRAEAALKGSNAAVLLNKANILKVKGDYEKSMNAAKEARELDPTFSACHLMVIAIIENERAENRLDQLKDAVAYMQHKWPDWQEDTDLWAYLQGDADYSRLRSSGELESILGHPAKGIEQE